jgi:hypothetical protein
VILQHDNARQHTANMTKATIQELDWEILPHPPYSPDLASSDYHLFRSLSLSLQQTARSFLQQRRWAPKIGSTKSSRPNRQIFSSVGSKPYPNVGSQSWIMEGYI